MWNLWWAKWHSGVFFCALRFSPPIFIKIYRLNAGPHLRGSKWGLHKTEIESTDFIDIFSSIKS
jgi:hypothetical protein